MDLASRARLTELWACRNRSAASIDSAYVSLKEWERGSSEAHKLEAFTIIECSLGFECSMSRWNLVHEAAGWRGRIDARPRDRRDKRLWMDHKCISGALVQTSLAEDLVEDDGGRICATKGPGCSGWQGASAHRYCTAAVVGTRPPGATLHRRKWV
jgi:hypothetical protein